MPYVGVVCAHEHTPREQPRVASFPGPSKARTTRGLMARMRWVVAACLALGISGQTPLGAQASGGERRRPQVAPTRLPPGASIEIDGDLDDPAWQGVQRLDDLTQVEPQQGAAPTHPTEIRLAYDDNFFYVAWICFDDPGDVRARQMDRDAFVNVDDVVEVWFDTFRDQRFAFWFQMTPAGSRGDALIADGGNSFNKSWDGIWYGQARVTAEGWQAEIAIPFKTLAFREGSSTWGFNFKRERRANGEKNRWASPSLAYDFFNLAEGGELIGLTGMQQGVGIDLVPFVTLSHENDETLGGGTGDRSTLLDVGADLAWRVTSASTLRLTVNTDFAQADVDARRVNLTRFPLFFPEKREFFLEDAGLFEFGPPGSRGGGKPVVPFFSRQIGRNSEGEEVPLLAGIKYTGRVGDWNIGLLDAQVDDSFEADSSNLGVLRLSRNLGGRSSIGGIFTSGDPQSNGNASTAGLDARIGSSRAFGEGHSADIWAWWLNTDGQATEGDGQAFGLEARVADARWNHRAQAYSVGEAFDPAMGFVRRTGIRRYAWETRYNWRVRGESLREVEFRVSPSYTTDLSGEKDSWRVPVRWFELEFDTQDSVSIESRRIFERIDESFTVGGDVDITPGDYDQTRHVLRLEANDRRRVGGDMRIEAGDFYSGRILRWNVSPIVIPGRHVSLRVGYDDIDVKLDEGSFHTQVVEAGADFSFSPNLSWKNLVQYDTETYELGVQSRVRWILAPGNDLFIVALLGWAREEDDPTFVPTNQDFTLKFGYTIRF